MRRATTTTQAQRTRDEGLTRVRRITWLAGLGAAAFTAVASLVAATTIPGHSQTSSPPASVSSGDTLPNPTNQPPSAGPAQGSPPNAGSGPVIASGGS